MRGEGGVFKLGGGLAAEEAQKLHALAGENASEGVPAFKGVMAFMEGFAALGTMPGVDEPAREFVFHRAGDSDFHVFHRCRVKLIVSQVPKSRPGTSAE